MTIHLREVTVDNVRTACALTLEPQQERFVAPVAVSLAEAYVQPDIAWPRLVYDDDQLVGFLMTEFDQGEDPWLWRLNIAAGHQGAGDGRFAVQELMREAQRRDAERLLTSYVPGDDGPAGFYASLGFTPTGEVEDGEIVVVLPLGSAG